MIKHKDILGQSFNQLRVIKLADHRNKQNIILWECLCACGNTCTATTGELNSGRRKSCGCHYERQGSRSDQSFIGQKIGKLLVKNLYYIDNKRNACFKCLCDCGNEVVVKGVCLRKGTKSCGCLRIENLVRVAKNRKHKKYKGIIYHFWNRIIRNAITRNIPMDITIEQAWELYVLQERKCALSKLEIEFPKTHKDEATASLDRIDSSKGYTIDNVQWVHKKVNLMKHVLGQEEFIQLCKIIAKNN